MTTTMENPTNTNQASTETYTVYRKGVGEVEMTADEIRSALSQDPEDHVAENGDVLKVCPVCLGTYHQPGYAPHIQKHLRLIGDVPPHGSRPRRNGRKSHRAVRRVPVRSSQPQDRQVREEHSVEEACVDLISEVTGMKFIPTPHLAVVTEWISTTKEMLAEISHN
jgi:hypothetical protein